MPLKRVSPSKGKAKKEVEKDEEYDNTNSGVLFENEKKVKKNHPDFQGNFTDDQGREFWVSGWERESRSGQYYISLAFTEKNVEDEDVEIENDAATVKRSRRKNG